MKLKNLSKNPLVLATGDVLSVGQEIEVKDFDEKHPVTKAWLEAGLIEKSTAKAKADDAEAEKPQTKTTAKE